MNLDGSYHQVPQPTAPLPPPRRYLLPSYIDESRLGDMAQETFFVCNDALIAADELFKGIIKPEPKPKSKSRLFSIPKNIPNFTYVNNSWNWGSNNTTNNETNNTTNVINNNSPKNTTSVTNNNSSKNEESEKNSNNKTLVTVVVAVLFFGARFLKNVYRTAAESKNEFNEHIAKMTITPWRNPQGINDEKNYNNINKVKDKCLSILKNREIQAKRNLQVAVSMLASAVLGALGIWFSVQGLVSVGAMGLAISGVWGACRVGDWLYTKSQNTRDRKEYKEAQAGHEAFKELKQFRGIGNGCHEKDIHKQYAGCTYQFYDSLNPNYYNGQGALQQY